MHRPVYRISHILIAGVLLGAATRAWPGEHPKEHPTAAKTETQAKPEAGKAAGDATLKGEVVDMVCFLQHEGKGKKHRKCAEQCVIEKNAPAGLLTDDGKLYLLIEDHHEGEPYKEAIKRAGDTAVITGKLVEKAGIKAIVVKKAEAK